MADRMRGQCLPHHLTDIAAEEPELIRQTQRNDFRGQLVQLQDWRTVLLDTPNPAIGNDAVGLVHAQLGM